MNDSSIKPHLLFLNNASKPQNLLLDFFVDKGYQTHELPAHQSLQHYLRCHPVHLAVLNRGMRLRDEFLWLKQLKTLYPQLPVVMLSDQQESAHAVQALEMGANDYLRNPVEPPELLARIRIILSYSYPDWVQKTFESEHLLFDFEQEIFKKQGIMLNLTPRESELLYVFCQNQNQLLSREYLAEKIMHKNYHPLDRHIDVYINHLRKKIEVEPKNPQYIRTVWGQGYLFSTTAH